MKIPPPQINAFISKPGNDYSGALIYGPDNGLVTKRMQDISTAIVPDGVNVFNISDFTYELIKEKPALLADSLAAISFYGGRRLVRVRDMPPSLPKELADVILAPHPDSFLLMTADELPAASSLRKLFEVHEQLAAIPCYQDDGISLRRLIENRIIANGFQYDADVVPYLIESLAGDRQLIDNELAKLMLYMGENLHITLDDARACISADPIDSSLDNLVIAVASRDAMAISKNITMLQAENISPIAMVRAISNYFMRLYLVNASLAAGVPMQEAMGQLRPPVFFKQVATFQKHLELWPTGRLLSVIGSLAQLEADCKKTGMPAELLCNHFFTLIGARKSA